MSTVANWKYHIQKREQILLERNEEVSIRV